MCPKVSKGRPESPLVALRKGRNLFFLIITISKKQNRSTTMLRLLFDFLFQISKFFCVKEINQRYV